MQCLSLDSKDPPLLLPLPHLSPHHFFGMQIFMHYIHGNLYPSIPKSKATLWKGKGVTPALLHPVFQHPNTLTPRILTYSYHYTLLPNRVPGEIKRSRDLRGGRWSWTLNLAQKRSWVGRSWASWTSFASSCPSCSSTAVQRTLS